MGAIHQASGLNKPFDITFMVFIKLGIDKIQAFISTS